MLLPDQSQGNGPSDADAHSGTPRAWRSVRRRRWQAVCAILALGVAGSIVAALMWRSSVRARERQTFETSAANVSGTLETLLRRDTDFVRSVRAVMSRAAEPERQRL